jgi:hypothetical protein
VKLGDFVTSGIVRPLGQRNPDLRDLGNAQQGVFEKVQPGAIDSGVPVRIARGLRFWSAEGDGNSSVGGCEQAGVMVRIAWPVATDLGLMGALCPQSGEHLSLDKGPRTWSRRLRASSDNGRPRMSAHADLDCGAGHGAQNGRLTAPCLKHCRVSQQLLTVECSKVRWISRRSALSPSSRPKVVPRPARSVLCSGIPRPPVLMQSTRGAPAFCARYGTGTGTMCRPLAGGPPRPIRLVDLNHHNERDFWA